MGPGVLNLEEKHSQNGPFLLVLIKVKILKQGFEEHQEWLYLLVINGSF